jgi:hypothetical protein
MNIFEYKGYYQDYLNKSGINLTDHYVLPNKISLNIDSNTFIHYFEKEAFSHQEKYTKPRPFHPYPAMFQATCVAELGYNQYNTTEINIGLNDLDNQALKNLIGEHNFLLMNLDSSTCLVRMLRYDPGHGIPLHTDHFNAFKEKYGNDRRIIRYFVAINPWDWGHFLQLHDNMIHNWEVGDCYEIEEGIYHLSANFGIVPKYTLVITGFTDE